MKALLNPEAKNPPNGPITLLNNERDKECSTNGGIEIVAGNPNYKPHIYNKKKNKNKCMLTVVKIPDKDDGRL